MLSHPPDDWQSAAKFAPGDIVFVSEFDGHENKTKTYLGKVDGVERGSDRRFLVDVHSTDNKGPNGPFGENLV